MIILNLYGIPFHAVVVFRPEHDFLFKSASSYCVGGYSAQAIKECIDYELKSADNPCVLTNFCKLLSLTYYNTNA